MQFQIWFAAASYFFGPSGLDLVHNALVCKILIQIGVVQLLVGLGFCAMASSNPGVVSSSLTMTAPVLVLVLSFSSITTITTKKLNGKNYISRLASI